MLGTMTEDALLNSADNPFLATAHSVDGTVCVVDGVMGIAQRNGTRCSVSALEPGGVSPLVKPSLHNVADILQLELRPPGEIFRESYADNLRRSQMTYYESIDVVPLVIQQHRTSSLDHIILSQFPSIMSLGNDNAILIFPLTVSGCLVLIMEDCFEHLMDQPGSIVIQRGTMHGWCNSGPDWATWVAITVDALPVGGKEGKALRTGSMDWSCEWGG